MKNIAKIVAMHHAIKVSPSLSWKGIAPFLSCDLPAYPLEYKKETAGHTITVRVASMDKDYQLIKSWMCSELGLSPGKEKLTKFVREGNRQLNKASFGRSYLLFYDKVPVSAADLIDATRNDIAFHYDAESGDCNLNVLFAPTGKPSGKSYVKIISALLEVIFLGSVNTNRVVLTIEKQSDYNEWIVLVGFDRYIKAHLDDANLYICTRESFRHMHQENEKFNWSIQF